MISCFECGAGAEHDHHVVPRSLGGTRTVPLCERCHSKVHNVSFHSHRRLTIAGLRKLQQKGVKLGAPSMIQVVDRPGNRFVDPGKVAIVRYVQGMYATGNYSHRTLAEQLNGEGFASVKGAKWHSRAVRVALMTVLPEVPR